MQPQASESRGIRFELVNEERGVAHLDLSDLHDRLVADFELVDSMVGMPAALGVGQHDVRLKFMVSAENVNS